MTSTRERSVEPLAGGVWRLNELSPLIGRFIVIAGGLRSHPELKLACLGVDHYDENADISRVAYIGPHYVEHDERILSLWLPEEPSPIRSFFAAAALIPRSHLDDRVGAVRRGILKGVKYAARDLLNDPQQIEEAKKKGTYYTQPPEPNEAFIEDIRDINKLSEATGLYLLQAQIKNDPENSFPNPN